MAIEDDIIAVLSKPEVAKIDFTLSAIKIDGSSFKRVRTAIQQAKIKVVYSSDLGKAVAKYNYIKNTITVGFSAVKKDGDLEALVVHECTHAACDIAGKKLLVVESEAAAFVAQCLYFYHLNAAELAKPGVSPTFADPILKAAWAVAAKARSKSVLSSADIEPLTAAVTMHAKYKSRHSELETYDGI